MRCRKFSLCVLITTQRREPEGVTSEMAFGKKGELSEELRNFGVAMGWGGLPKQGALCIPSPRW